jgi:hypothetical protein
VIVRRVILPSVGSMISSGVRLQTPTKIASSCSTQRHPHQIQSVPPNPSLIYPAADSLPRVYSLQELVVVRSIQSTLWASYSLGVEFADVSDVIPFPLCLGLSS